MKVDLAPLDPAPTAMVANLPYSVATPLILRTIAELPSLERWTVMVQREIAERLRARPGSRSYGSPSVVVQLSCDVTDAADGRSGRVQPAPAGRLRPCCRCSAAAPARGSRQLAQLIRDAFAHRRKALPRSLELAVRRREQEAEQQGLPAPRPRSAEIRHLQPRSARAAWGCRRASGPRC